MYKKNLNKWLFLLFSNTYVPCVFVISLPTVSVHFNSGFTDCEIPNAEHVNTIEVPTALVCESPTGVISKFAADTEK